VWYCCPRFYPPRQEYEVPSCIFPSAGFVDTIFARVGQTRRTSLSGNLRAYAKIRANFTHGITSHFITPAGIFFPNTNQGSIILQATQLIVTSSFLIVLIMRIAIPGKLKNFFSNECDIDVIPFRRCAAYNMYEWDCASMAIITSRQDSNLEHSRLSGCRDFQIEDKH